MDTHSVCSKYLQLQVSVLLEPSLPLEQEPQVPLLVHTAVMLHRT